MDRKSLREVSERNAKALRKAGYTTEGEVQAMFSAEIKAYRAEKRDRKEAAEGFRRISAEMGRTAAAAGWDDEWNEALLRGDLDTDESWDAFERAKRLRDQAKQAEGT